MPKGDPDFADPQELVGVALPGGAETVREMARAFAEEFVQLGWREDRLLALFRDPHYAGAHQAFQALGPSEIAQIVRDAGALWGGFRVKTTDADEGPGLFRGRRLRVLQPAGR